MIVFFTLINLSLIFLLARWVWRATGSQDKVVYWSALVLRLACGISVGLLYKYYYTDGDTFVFFNDAARLTQTGFENPSLYFRFLLSGSSPFELVTNEPRSLFFVSIVSGFGFITNSNYWLTSLWFSLIAFACSWRLVLKLDQIFPATGIASRIALLFFPSVIFWTSGIMKESLSFAAIAIIATHFLSIMHGHKLKVRTMIIELPIAIYILLSLKYYWAAVLFPAMISSLIIYWTVDHKWKRNWSIFAAWTGVFATLCLVVSVLHPNFYLSRFLSVVVENNQEITRISSQPNIIHYYNLTESWLSLLINSPWALISGLFRPIFEITTTPGIVASLENVLLLVLFLWKLRYFRMPKSPNRLIVLTAVVFVVLLCIFLALSTPNLGTLSRYRVGFLPVFVFMVMAGHPLLNSKRFQAA